MRGAVIHAPGDVRFEQLDDPKIEPPSTTPPAPPRRPTSG
jgi:hypothetical protein